MITAGFNKDNTSRSVALTKAILRATSNNDDQGYAHADTPIQSSIPMIADRAGKTPLQLMSDLNLKALSDTLLDFYLYENLI